MDITCDGWQIISSQRLRLTGLLAAPSDQGQHAWPHVSCRRMK